MSDPAQVPNRSIRTFNSPLECGLRLLFVLDAAGGAPSDLQRLVSYDYLLVHSGDVTQSLPSLHPPIPFRASELLVKRDVVRQGLNKMYSKELLEKGFEPTGIAYRATKLTTAFLKLLRSPYSEALRIRARWLVEFCGPMDDGEFAGFMSEDIGRWGPEFDRHSAPVGVEL
ncbi:ABC-three component system middle component 2 [Maricaulis sp.]|uniref:ABC-three component system middle component 2 n=1 Tax=Maricaulis sp. TaxID=1486257 RepID=UPI003A90A190